MVAHRRSGQRGAMVLGVVLIALGALFFALQTLRPEITFPTWPLWVIVPGAILFLLAFAVGGEAGAAVAAVGAVVATTGLVLLYQSETGHWTSWAYAWALVAPGSIGLGLLVYGVLAGEPRPRAAGLPALLAGIGLFVGFGLFFEGVLGLSGPQYRIFGDWLLPAVLIVIGAILIGRSLLARRTGRG